MDTLNKFGVPIDGARAGMLMPKPKHRFRVRFSNFGPLNSNQSVDLSRQVATCDRPKLQYDEVEVHSYNSRAYYAGKYQWQTITCGVRDDITDAVSKLVGYQIQKQLNFFEQTSALAGENYKFTMKLEILDGGNEAQSETWNLEGCFLQNIDYDQGDYATADPLMINMTIRFDNATLENGLFPDSPELLGGVRI